MDDITKLRDEDRTGIMHAGWVDGCWMLVRDGWTGGLLLLLLFLVVVLSGGRWVWPVDAGWWRSVRSVKTRGD